MRVGYRPLIFRALVVLQEAATAARAAAVPVSPGVRLALAYLYGLSSGNRRRFDEFADIIAKEDQVDRPPGECAYVRGTNAQGCLSAIMREIGFDPTAATDSALRGAASGAMAPNARRFWNELDQQVYQRTRRPRRGCPWTFPQQGVRDERPQP